MKKFKVAVIGGGPGGYVAGIRLKQNGIETVVFEKERLGGVCLNWGCIPTKSLVKICQEYSDVCRGMKEGWFKGKLEVDFVAVKDRQNKIVNQLTGGIELLYKKRNIPLVNQKVVAIRKSEDGFVIRTGEDEYFAEYIILATGSTPVSLSFMPFDGNRILSSRDILAAKDLPRHLVIVGGGVIGCEFACIYNQLGVKVEIVEFLPRLIAAEDEEISRRLTTSMKKMKIKLHLNTAVEEYTESENGVQLKLSNGKEISTEKVLVSIGRKPVFNIELENFQLKIEKGYVTIDEQMRSTHENIFAVGDLTGKMMLAHTASKQGIIAAEVISAQILGNYPPQEELQYQNIPRCTFTEPEIASAGYTETEAKEKFGDILVGKFNFAANGKALASGSNTGFVKIIARADNEKIAGIHIAGLQAAELIAQASIILGLEADLKRIEQIVFAHPTLSEAIAEAVEDTHDRAIHKI